MKDRVALFFDSAAEGWDSKNAPDPGILEKITGLARVTEGCSVLDAGCGTGVLFPFFLKRKAGSITGVDISEKMLAEARRKYGDNGITYVCSDITDFSADKKFSCVITHNAFPHFLRQKEAMERLKELTAPGGTLTVAHSISRAAVLQCHKNIPDISLELPEAQVLAAMLGSGFEELTVLSDEKRYIVSAKKKG